MGLWVVFRVWLRARGGRGRWWGVGMIFINCQHRNTLVKIQVSMALHELSEILELYIFLYLYQKNLQVDTPGRGGRKGEKGNCGKMKEISDMQRGYTTRSKRKERKYDENFEPNWFTPISRNSAKL